MKEYSEKAGLKLNIQKTKNMAYGPITLWKIDGEKVRTMMDFIFLGSKITLDSDCGNEMKTPLATWKKNYDEPRQHIKRQGCHFVDKGLLVKAMFFQ